MKNPTFIIDFDSTLVRCESLDELARIALAGQPDQAQVMAKLEEFTRLGMTGELPFNRSLGHRLALFRAKRQHVAALVERLSAQVSPSVLRHRDWLADNARRIYVVSGGFADYIIPIVRELGVPAERVLANRFIYDNDVITGYDPGNVLSRNGGKAQQVAALGLSGRVVAVGDGYTDYEIKEQGYADEFWAFTETVRRPEVVAQADRVIDDFAAVAAGP